MKNKVNNISIISTGSWVPPDLKNNISNKKNYKILINELVLKASIGIHDFEKKKKQKISLSMELEAKDNISEVHADIENFISYEVIIDKIKKLLKNGHIDLLETLAEKIFDLCFDDKRILSVNLKLEKLEVFKETKSVGIQIIRNKPNNYNSINNSKNISRLKK